MRFKGSSAIVTAAGQGIGRATAIRLRDDGARVYALDRDADAIGEIDGVEPIVLDLLDASAIAGLPKRLGSIDILANVAGYVASGTALGTSEDDWRLSFALSVDAAFHMIRAFLPGMLAQRHGSIINMSSVASSVKGIPNRCAYGASKAAVIGLTKAVAADHVAEGVRCNAICPGTIDTPSLRQRIKEAASAQSSAIDEVEAAFVQRQPMQRLGRDVEIAALIAYLASDDASFTTGAIHIIDGGWVN